LSNKLAQARSTLRKNQIALALACRAPWAPEAPCASCRRTELVDGTGAAWASFVRRPAFGKLINMRRPGSVARLMRAMEAPIHGRNATRPPWPPATRQPQGYCRIETGIADRWRRRCQARKNAFLMTRLPISTAPSRRLRANEFFLQMASTARASRLSRGSTGAKSLTPARLTSPDPTWVISETPPKFSKAIRAGDS